LTSNNFDLEFNNIYFRIKIHWRKGNMYRGLMSGVFYNKERINSRNVGKHKYNRGEV